ncbi:MAG: FAD-containing monooxygenase EthA [Robiginitomaculum sp.]|nr:MAG: FAD-containing monooxygenase EthA [Robiginitomaculum sp.]
MTSPDQNFAILEARESFGGTWDLFKYPGVRSDSDMYTFGYSFHPWTEGRDIASGESILNYLNETAQAYGVDKKIRYSHKVGGLNWDSAQSKWIIDILATDARAAFQMSCNFVLSCMGYYNYEHGYLPKFEGYDSYKGTLVHPQFWPEDLDYTDKKILVIGSGATAITLVPSMADKAAHVTMLQRSPTYVFTRPGEDKIATFFKRILPKKLAYKLARFKNVLITIYMFKHARKNPDKVRKFLRDMAVDELGDSVDVDVHFKPSYDPWDQRLCLIPDADLFSVLKDGRASIVTDHIETFTETGVRLKSGESIDADIIIPATGLDVQFFGGIDTCIDGEKVNSGELINYKGMMFANVPNLAAVFGYTNASWTLKADLTSNYVARLLNHMRKHDYKTAVPKLGKHDMKTELIVGLQSGYLLRKSDEIPKQGDQLPWRNPENYLKDYKRIRWGKIDDGVMSFK